MKKIFRNKIFIGTVLLFVIVGAFLIFKNNKNKASIAPTSTNQVPGNTSVGSSSAPSKTVDSVVISGIKVNNFYKNTVSQGELGDVLFVDNPTYKVIYYPLDTAFLISIQASPFESVRSIAEQDFLKQLGITKSQACKLSVWITTPNYINPNYAGKNYQLSFCK